MNLKLNLSLAENYTSQSQTIRRISEDWVQHNSYCPRCGYDSLSGFENNRPVADFYCQQCQEEFELKSKKGPLAGLVVDGAYSTMIERINADNNPNFFFLSYSKDWMVNDFMIIPKHFFTPQVILKRPALSATAKRAGWVGCNIDISKITDQGKIFLIKNGAIVNQNTVRQTFEQTLFLRKQTVQSRGWTLDILQCLDLINQDHFTLDEMYRFEQLLQVKYPNNHHIKDKIRQQLQILRDQQIVEFIGRGHYRKISAVH